MPPMVNLLIALVLWWWFGPEPAICWLIGYLVYLGIKSTRGQD